MVRARAEVPASFELSRLVEAVAEALDARPLSPDSRSRLTDLMARFAAYADRGCGVTIASAVTAEVVEGYVRARSAQGSPPAVATMHVRRSAARLLFAQGRRLGLVPHDPTMDLALPPRSYLHTRPLTDDEVALCRAYAAGSSSETRRPAAWALAEATARSAEIAVVTVENLDLERGRVWIPGSSKTDPRWGYLSSWGIEQIQRRVRPIRPPAVDTRLVCPTADEGVSRTSSASAAIAHTLRRAGLHHEPDVRPPSVAAWAGRKALEGGDPIDQVALMLGIRSLDRAASFIGWAWRALA